MLSVSGLIVGAALVSFASWPAVFYLIAVVCFVMGALVAVLLPFSRNHDNDTGSRLETFKRIDTVGVMVLTGAPHLCICWTLCLMLCRMQPH